MTILVHHLENSRSQRILWMLEELGLPYRVQHYKRNARTMLAPPELKAVHPLGKSPVIEDVIDNSDAGNAPVVVAETGAIVEYLVGKAGGALGAPADADGARRYTHFLHYAEGSMMPPLLALLVIQKLGLLGRPARGAVQGMMDTHLDWLENELATRPFFAGAEFTAADIMMSFPLEAARSRAGLSASRPHLIGWLGRMHARPAYQAALKAGGPYAFA